MIVEFRKEYEVSTIRLILSIQQEELGVKITEADQPDLKTIDTVYQQGLGNFWVAVDNGQVVGTIALIDIGNQEVALRKMFVHPDYRGKEKGTAQLLINTLINWCREKEVKNVYLGTIDIMKAAHRFYEKNGFVQLHKNELPANFPVMRVDNVFYKLSFANL